MLILSKGDSVQIREVWNNNLEEEFMLIHEIVDEYNYVAMDTKFHGVVLRPMENFKNINDYNYQTLKDNVDMLNLIQLGIFACNSIELLHKCGINFKKMVAATVTKAKFLRVSKMMVATASRTTTDDSPF
ncbi:putative CCR4-associated factor 1 10 [Glycine soja]